MVIIYNYDSLFFWKRQITHIENYQVFAGSYMKLVILWGFWNPGTSESLILNFWNTQNRQFFDSDVFKKNPGNWQYLQKSNLHERKGKYDGLKDGSVLDPNYRYNFLFAHHYKIHFSYHCHHLRLLFLTMNKQLYWGVVYTSIVL